MKSMAEFDGKPDAERKVENHQMRLPSRQRRVKCRKIVTKSITKLEIERYWKNKHMEEDDHLFSAIKAAARIRARNLTEEVYKRFEESLDDTNMDEYYEESSVGIKDWYIRLEDLMRFMGKDEAEKTLSLFEGASETGKICKSSLKNWVVKAFRERRALSLTLNDTKTAVKRLHQMVNVVVAVVIGLIWLTMLGVTTRKLILVFGSQLVVCAFIFGNTLKNIFEALVFLFIVHPFDVGDRCEIDGKEYVVEEMNILSTVFLRDDNLKVTYMNFMLAMKGIHNFNRSPDMGDAIDFRVHIATPAEKIAQIKQRIMSYIEHKKEHWSSPMIVMRDVEELEMVKFSVWLCHTTNFQDMGERFKRRAQLVEEMVKIFKDVDLDYRKYRISKKERNDVQMPGPNSARLPPTWAPRVQN